MQDFRNLDAWHKAHALALDVHKLLARSKRVDAHLRSQLSRAARSVAATLVEGCGKDSHLELARYADIGIGSCSEVEYWMLLGRDIGYFAPMDCERITAQVIEIRKMLFGLRRSIREKRATERRRSSSEPENLAQP